MQVQSKSEAESSQVAAGNTRKCLVMSQQLSLSSPGFLSPWKRWVPQQLTPVGAGAASRTFPALPPVLTWGTGDTSCHRSCRQ